MEEVTNPVALQTCPRLLAKKYKSIELDPVEVISTSGMGLSHTHPTHIAASPIRERETAEIICMVNLQGREGFSNNYAANGNLLDQTIVIIDKHWALFVIFNTNLIRILLGVLHTHIQAPFS